tara:strand:- start:2899 stop:3156 length:258 start_codon:yes stop_codon:yes gene_type:complete
MVLVLRTHQLGQASGGIMNNDDEEKLPVPFKSAPSAQYSVTLRLEYPHEPGWIAAISTVIAQEGGGLAQSTWFIFTKGELCVTTL